MPLPQAIGFFSFLVAIISIWFHMEISLAELNVEIFNVKQDLSSISDNRRDSKPFVPR